MVSDEAVVVCAGQCGVYGFLCDFHFFHRLCRWMYGRMGIFSMEFLVILGLPFDCAHLFDVFDGTC